MIHILRISALATLLAIAATAARADFSGLVIGVLDGDTVDVLVDKKPVRVRLAEIDAPEKKQPFGTRSRQALSTIVFKRDVTVIEHGSDWRGKRTVGSIRVDGVDVNRAMVAAGMAWVYPRYVKDRSLYIVQDLAKQKQLGLWTDDEPTPPWQWRAEQRAATAATWKASRKSTPELPLLSVDNTVHDHSVNSRGARPA